MHEAQPLSDEGLEWQRQGWHKRVETGIETEIIVEGATKDEILERRLRKLGVETRLVSSPDIIRQAKLASFITKLLHKPRS